jgi:CheY-like chemotaxis protein
MLVQANWHLGASHASLATPRVLIVDRDADVRVALRAALEREGFVTTVEETGEETIWAVERERYDAAVLDQDLPDISGLDLVFFLKHRCPGIPIVLTTQSSGPLTVEAARRRGARACVIKPIDAARLGDLLRDVIRPRRPVSLGRMAPAAEPPSRLVASIPGAVWAVLLPPRRQGYLTDQDPDGVREAVDRVATLAAVRRTVVVGVRRHAKDVGRAWDAASGPKLLVQPRDAGTAAELLLAAWWIHRQDPGATVAVFPSETAVGAPAGAAPRLSDQVGEVAAFVDRYPRWIVLVGADRADGHGSGLIVPGDVLTWTNAGLVWRVDRLLDARFSAYACRPRTAEVLANTGILVAKAAQLVEAGRVFVPRLHRGLLPSLPLLGTPSEALAMRRAYANAPRSTRVHSILQPCTPWLAAVRLAAPGA